MAYHLNKKIFAVSVAMILSTASANTLAQNPLENFISGMKKITEQGEKDRAAIRNNQQPSDSSGPGLAGTRGNIASVEVAEEPQATPAKIAFPKDKKTAMAVDEAMPLIKKIVSMHRCMKNNAALRQWNFDAIPGVDMMKFVNVYWPKTGLPIEKMEYHDNNRCLNASTIDQFAKPAENALLFRAVYFAGDSGETDNFLYLLMKTDDGWKIRQFERGPRG